MMSPVRVHLLDVAPPPATVRAMRRAVQSAMRQLDVPGTAEVAVVLTGDDRLRSLNRQYRGLDEPTDVLSFATSSFDLPGEALELGDILISLPAAERNARSAGWSVEAELCLLAVHGLLHLLGHDDETEEEAQAMRMLETELGVRPKQGNQVQSPNRPS